MDEDREAPTRVRFFEGQLLTAHDFQDEQSYLVGKRWLHNRALHGSGVVEGLEVEMEGGRITVSPGLAIDGLGREIVVPGPAAVDLTDWQEGLTLCLHYAERPGGTPRPTTDGAELDRIEETFELALRGGLPAVPARLSDEDCAELFADAAAPPRDPPDDCVVLATVLMVGGKPSLDAETYRRRLPGTAELYDLILCLARRVRALERGADKKKPRRRV